MLSNGMIHTAASRACAHARPTRRSKPRCRRERALTSILQSVILTGGAVSAILAPAAAQSVLDPSAVPVRAASAQPFLGEEVLDAHGVVASAEFLENRICTIRGCRSFIFDRRSGALIFSDGAWAPAYAPTGRGFQVIRVKDFTPAELPGPAPDDKALETAPGIIKVTRPTPPNSE
jgi:hypothetical protein